jgi:hypothetical protein
MVRRSIPPLRGRRCHMPMGPAVDLRLSGSTSGQSAVLTAF